MRFADFHFLGSKFGGVDHIFENQVVEESFAGRCLLENMGARWSVLDTVGLSGVWAISCLIFAINVDPRLRGHRW